MEKQVSTQLPRFGPSFRGALRRFAWREKGARNSRTTRGKFKCPPGSLVSGLLFGWPSGEGPGWKRSKEPYTNKCKMQVSTQFHRFGRIRCMFSVCILSLSLSYLLTSVPPSFPPCKFGSSLHLYLDICEAIIHQIFPFRPPQP